MNHTTIWIIALAVIASAVLGAFKRRPRAAAYVAKGPLCTPTETAFLATLEQVLPDTERAFTHVRLIDVIEPKRHDQAAKNRVISKHLDFVICDRRTLRVLYAIELNDKSHDQPSRRSRDAFLAEAMASAGIPLHFFKAAARYSPAEIRARLNPATPETASPKSELPQSLPSGTRPIALQSGRRAG